MDNPTINMRNHETVELRLASGRTITLWLHECDACVSLDVHTSRGREIENISANTAGTSNAPMGVFAWRNGSRVELPVTDAWPALDTAGKRTPVSGITVIWNDNASDDVAPLPKF